MQQSEAAIAAATYSLLKRKNILNKNTSHISVQVPLKDAKYIFYVS